MKFKFLLLIAVVFSTIFTSCNNDEVTLMGNWVDKAFYEGRQRAEGSSFEITDFG
jgi:hypothetical protein